MKKHLTLMHPDDTLPSIPAFLDRKRWTKEQWQNSQKGYKRALVMQAMERAVVEARAQAAKEAKRVKEAAIAAQKQERLAKAERRAQGRILQAAVLQLVKQELDRGTVTVKGLRQLVPEDKKRLVPWALRTMLKTGEAKRVSRQLYQRNKKHA